MDRTRRAAAGVGVLFLLALGLTVLMLLTDTNLRTDFGSMSSGYFSHWYVVLATGVADAIGATLLLVVGSRRTIQVGAVGAGLIALLFVADVLTYSQVGFSSAQSFASYLFGWTASSGNIRFLYDVLLGVYVVTAATGVGVLRTRRRAPTVPASMADGTG